MLPGLMMPLPHSKFLTCRLTWAAMHSAACFQAVRLSLQGLTQVTWFRSAMLPGLRMPQGLKLRLRMWAAPAGLTMPLPDSKFLTCRLTWAAMRSAACLQAVRLSLQGLTQVTRFRSAMLPGLMMPLLLLPRRPLRPPSWLLRRSWMPQGLWLR